MSGAILALFCVVLGAALIEFLVPGEDKEGPKRFLHVMTALVVLLLILRPFSALLGRADGFLSGDEVLLESEEGDVDYEKVFVDAVANRSAEELKRGLYALLEKEFEIDSEECSVGVTLNDAGELQCIAVRLQKGGLLCDPREIEERLMELFSCEVEVR